MYLNAPSISQITNFLSSVSVLMNRIQDRSIGFSIKPEFDNQLFVDFAHFVQVANNKLFLFWFAELEEQLQVHNLCKTRKSIKNWC